jgi:hypothetical protein
MVNVCYCSFWCFLFLVKPTTQPSPVHQQAHHHQSVDRQQPAHQQTHQHQPAHQPEHHNTLHINIKSPMATNQLTFDSLGLEIKIENYFHIFEKAIDRYDGTKNYGRQWPTLATVRSAMKLIHDTKHQMVAPEPRGLD